MAEGEYHFEHPLAIFPEEHYLLVRELVDAAADEAPPCQNFPDMWWSTLRSAQEMATKQCMTSCAIRATCLNFALETGEVDGIWGGLTPQERKALKPRINKDEDGDRRTGTTPGEPPLVAPPAGPGDDWVQEGAARHHRASRGKSAAQPAAAHRPLRTRQPL